jgi:surface protein
MLRNVNTSEKKDSHPMVHSSNTFNDIHSYETKRVRSEGTFLELTDSYTYAPDRAAMATYNTLFDKKENIRNQLVTYARKKKKPKNGHHYYFVQNKIWILRLVVLLVFLRIAEGLDPLPSVLCGSPPYCSTGLNKVVNDWFARGPRREGVITKYGKIEDWDMSGVTSLNYLFYNKMTVNADLSKWNVSSVTSLSQSTLQSHNNIFDSFSFWKQFFFFYTFLI